jgi:hypothetical protein
MEEYDKEASDLQQMDYQERHREVVEVLRNYRKGLTNEEGLKILCRECGIELKELS